MTPETTMPDYLDRCHVGDCRDIMRAMIADGVRVQCIVTSPPYWALRSYLPDGHPDKPREIGSEPTLREFIATLVGVFELCRELLADDGTAWVNMGDAYVGTRSAAWGPSEASTAARAMTQSRRRDDSPIPRSDVRVEGLKPKDMMGQPWHLAFALQDAGWYLRQEIIWHKPNPMPESVRDRCTKAHEYLFLLSKNERYYYDFDAMQEPVTGGAYADRQRAAGVNLKAVGGWATGDTPHTAVAHNRGARVKRPKQNESLAAAVVHTVRTRNRRSVWTIPSEPYSEAHFATFPQALVEPCVLAGSRVGDVVFDPFFGSGTMGQVAQRLGRHFIGCELNPEYAAMQRDRLRQPGLPLEVA